MNERMNSSLCRMNARISRANVRDCLSGKKTKNQKNYKTKNQSPKKVYITIYGMNVNDLSVSCPCRMTA